MTIDLDSFLSSLDSTIATVTSKSRLEAEKKSINTRIRTTDPSRIKRIELAGQIININAQLEQIQWKTVATVAMFQEQSCSYCGSVHRMFLQFMAKQSATSGPKCTRYSRVTAIQQNLPHEVITHRIKSTICGDCADDFGFDLGNASVKIAEHSEPFAIAPGYTTEEEEIAE